MPSQASRRDSAGLELRDYLRILRHRRSTIIVTVIVVVAGALAMALVQRPRYAANAKVLVQSQQVTSLFDPNTGQPTDPGALVSTQIEVITSETVKAAAAKKLHRPATVKAHQIGNTQAIQITARDTDPTVAQHIANTYAQAYIDLRRSQAIGNVVAATEQLSKKITDLQLQSSSLVAQLARDEVGKSPAQRAAMEEDVRNQQAGLSNQQVAFQQKLDQLQVEQSLQTGGAELLSAANRPTTPVSPRPIHDGVLAGGVGLILGLALAFLFEQLDDSIRSTDDAVRALGDVPVIGVVPAVTGWKERDKPTVISATEPASPAAEAYRTLSTALQFIALDRPVRTLQVTSSTTGEGKTTTVANLAVALARAGLRVIVVCCDLRRPRIHEFFGLQNAVGFTSALMGTPLPQAVQSVPGFPNLRLLASGPPPPNPAEVLGSRRARDLLAAVVSECDVAIIDCPPVLPVADATILASRVDATLVVATPGMTNRSALHRAAQLLQQVQAPIVGATLNGVASDGAYGYGYGYGYAYTSGPDTAPGSGNGNGNGAAKGARPTEGSRRSWRRFSRRS